MNKDSEEQPEDPLEENALPLNVVNNYYLGNILKTVFENIYETESTSEPSIVKSENLISLLGLEFSGKKSLC